MSQDSKETDGDDEQLVKIKARAAKLTYPIRASKDGRARLSWQNRVYSFGKHNTPDSFVEFLHWRSIIFETGEAPLVHKVRLDLAHVAEVPEQAEPPSETESAVEEASVSPLRRGVLIAFGSFALLAFGFGVGWEVNSTFLENDSTLAVPKVDGVPLSDREVAIVRGGRVSDARFNAFRETEARGVAAFAQQLMEEGPTHAKHISRKYPAPK
ncbi:MAG: hypothetical protein AAF989_10420 [Planctomycetota bacterium]